MKPALLALLALALLAAGCTAAVPAGGQCSFNADCAAGLVCAGNFCNAPCGPGGACPNGMRCVAAPGTAVSFCAPATGDVRCSWASECAAPLVCNREGRCQPQCRTDYDCRVVNPFMTCASGACALACAEGSADCDGLARNGCEVDTRGDVAHCGACGNACRAGAHQSARCAAGACATRCDEGFADCDGDPANGCEADLSAPATCGGCATRCREPTSLCAARGGSFACVSRCVAPTPTECGGSCVDPATDVAHCGACGNACAAGANASATCAAGRCGAACAAGFGDCDGNAANGCEVDTRASVAHCGACGRVCAPRNATPVCAAGACRFGACDAGFADCDGDASNGCEAATATDDANCGACGVSCATRTTQTGTAHTCQAGQCLPRNDTCAGAQVIDLAAGTPLRVTASTRFARADRPAHCAKSSGADVWFRFTLTQPELVYADTLGATWDTALYFASSCTTDLPLPTESNQVVCSDDVAQRCKVGGTASQVYAVLQPGTWYLVLSGVAGEVGEVTLNVQHLPLGNGPTEEYPFGFFKGPTTFDAPLSGTGVTRAVCGGDGPERSYWWAQCPGDSGGVLLADTCDIANVSMNTVLYFRNGDGVGDVCSDDAPTRCPNNPTGAFIETQVRGVPGIRVLTLDTTAVGGPARLRTIYPYFGGV